MERRFPVWQFAGFVFAAVGGTLLHFLYEWTGESVFIAPFSGVNESTWEHMKLLFFPLFIFAIIQSFFFKEQKNFWCIKLIGILAGILLIPLLFYTYNGVFGKSPDWINITIFFISAAAAFVLEAQLFKSGKVKCKHPIFAFSAICLMGAAFAVFTFFTPQIPIFEDPITGIYGLGG